MKNRFLKVVVKNKFMFLLALYICILFLFQIYKESKFLNKDNYSLTLPQVSNNSLGIELGVVLFENECIVKYNGKSGWVICPAEDQLEKVKTALTQYHINGLAIAP